MLIDFHSHHPASNAIVCTADAAEPAKAPAILRCAGLLPDCWTAKKQDLLFDLLESRKDLQMGEIGLDRRFESILPMDRQTEILKQEISFAAAMERCISLHCVRATKPMLDILKELRFRPYSILWHGFTGSPETAAILGKLKVLISIGPRFSGEISELLKVSPFIVPETDYEGSDDSEHKEILRKQYLRFPENYPQKAEEFFRLFSTGC